MKLIALHGKGHKNLSAIVDDADYDWLNTFKWRNHRGYVSTWLKGRHFFMHHMLLQRKPDLENDHINRDKLDNRRCNLRYATRSENVRNTVRHNNTSGIRGVSFHGDCPTPWHCHCSFDSHYYFIGSYSTKEAAARAYVDFLDAAPQRKSDLRLLISEIKSRHGATIRHPKH